MKCRSCQSGDISAIFDMGDFAVSDFVAKQPSNLDKFKLKMMYCNHCSLAQLSESVDQSKMYGKYWYRSGTNDSMKAELNDIVDSILKVKTNIRSWIDVGSNDGSLLSNVPTSIYRVGIDPADNSFTEESKQYANCIIQDYFSYESINKNNFSDYGGYDVITAIAMFYDLDDPNKFLQDVNQILHKDGLLVLQLSYTPLMMQQLAFDGICHEHLCYYSLTSLQHLLSRHNLKIIDVQLNDTNGGSFRVYIQKENASLESFGTGPYRDVCKHRYQSVGCREHMFFENSIIAYKQFFDRVVILKEQVVNFIKQEKGKGKSIWVYGASTKGNTLLQYFGLDNTLIDGAAERSPYKFGMRTIVTDIPIYSEEYMRSVHPDYLLILPWHFISEFKEREKDYLNKGGKFIVPCPKFEVIDGKV